MTEESRLQGKSQKKEASHLAYEGSFASPVMGAAHSGLRHAVVIQECNRRTEKKVREGNRLERAGKKRKGETEVLDARNKERERK